MHVSAENCYFSLYYRLWLNSRVHSQPHSFIWRLQKEGLTIMLLQLHHSQWRCGSVGSVTLTPPDQTWSCLQKESWLHNPPTVSLSDDDVGAPAITSPGGIVSLPFLFGSPEPVHLYLTFRSLWWERTVPVYPYVTLNQILQISSSSSSVIPVVGDTVREFYIINVIKVTFKH